VVVAQVMAMIWRSSNFKPPSQRLLNTKKIRMDNEPPDGANGENGDPDLNTFSEAIGLLCDAHDKLDSQNIKTPAAVQIKTEVLGKISKAVDVVRMLRSI
jgi:hypothetical protein